MSHEYEEQPGLQDANIGLRWWYKQVLQRISSDRDVLILVDGEEGSGKSTLGTRLCKLFDPGFSSSQVGWGIAEAIKVALACSPGDAVLVDEAVEGLQAREAMTKENKAGQKWLQVCRHRNLIMVVCYPSLWDIDIYVREHRIAYRVFVEEQGKARVYERRKNPWRREAYWKLVAKLRFDALPDDDPVWGQIKDKKAQYTERVGMQAIQER